MNRLVVLAALPLIACTSDVDEQWDLNHDRIIAVRADKPGLVSGESTQLRGLIGHKYDTEDPDHDLVRIPPDEQLPILAGVVSPASLMDTVTLDGKATAPSEDRLVTARAELGLDAGAPVPVTVGTRFQDDTLNAITTVVYGASMDNPAIGDPMVDGKPAPDGSSFTVDSLVDVRLQVTIDEMFDVNWLTSVGQMHDFDLPKAYLRVEQDDPLNGSLVVVVRDRKGGVSWLSYSMVANPPPEMP